MLSQTWLWFTWLILIPALLGLWCLRHSPKSTFLFLLVLFLVESRMVKSLVIVTFIVWCFRVWHANQKPRTLVVK